ncbi:MAG: hypothetical protein ABII68_00995 [Pseudomonadota bacterium]
MCASDEFHFLPRVESASRYYDRLDDLDASADKKKFKPVAWHEIGDDTVVG